MPPTKPAKRVIRSSYTTRQKLDAISLAKRTSNNQAARELGLSASQISRWTKQEDILKAAKPSTRKIGAGDHAHYPDAEIALKEWILSLRKNGISVTGNIVKERMKLLLRTEFCEHYPGALEQFFASDHWFYRFLNRHDLSLRRRTKISQKLPADLTEKVVLFHRYIIKHRKKYNYDLSQIGNMDETPMFFDMVGNTTIDIRGTNTVHLRTTGNEKNHFTCVLTVLADGTKLKPMVIFKGKRLPKDLPQEIIVKMQDKGWMDEILMQTWVEKVWASRAGGLSKSKNLLVLDSFEGHKTESVKCKFQEHNCNMMIIPGGLTSIVQPLDVCLNKPFKDRMREKWRLWMANEEFSLTKGGNLRKPSYKIICEWIIQAWKEIPTEMVKKSFLKCGISNEMNGQQDNLLYESDDDNLDDDEEMVENNNDV